MTALVFDVDGTLYRQRLLRRAMATHLLARHLTSPIRGWRTMRILRSYRHAQERLRAAPTTGDIAAAQIAIACDETGMDRALVDAEVTRWMHEEPLAFLPRCIQPGLLAFLQRSKERGLRLGVLSDYPAESKLAALGLSSAFDVVVCAQDPAINVFKPNPRGLLVALERLGASPSESLYIGDRVDVDVPTAAAAGVGCAIVTSRPHPSPETGHVEVASYSELGAVLWP